MNPWTVVLTPEAQRDILRLDAALQTRLLNRLEWLGENVELVRHQALQGEEKSGTVVSNTASAITGSFIKWIRPASG